MSAPQFLRSLSDGGKLVVWLGLAYGVGLTVWNAPSPESPVARDPGMRIARALEIPNARAPAGQTAAPSVLSTEDRTRYEKIFRVQKRGDWDTADRLIAALEDRLLLGHVLAQRYLHRTRYRATFSDLAAWLEAYSDHPDAKRIHKLALKRKPASQAAPRRPSAKQRNIERIRPAAVTYRHRSRKKLRRFERRQVARWKKQIRRNLGRSYLSQTEELLSRAAVQRLFDRFELDEANAALASARFYHGDIRKAFRLADAAAARSGRKLPLAHWTAGLAAWRLGQFPVAARHFEALARSHRAAPSDRSAGAYWAARVHMKLNQRGEAEPWLAIAAEQPHTFYGLLARERLGLKSDSRLETSFLKRSAVERLLAAPAGARSIALLQVGERRRAEKELIGLYERVDPGVTKAILALAAYGGLPRVNLRVAWHLLSEQSDNWSEGSLCADLYPIPPWRPAEGFLLDRALIFAVIRQESSFNPTARSPDGARGLMQLMPTTAAAFDPKRNFRGREKRALYDPTLNLSLGQSYLRNLLSSRRVGDNLVRLAVAYNAGPGNLAKWSRSMKSGHDPLLFIETIPVIETRRYVRGVLRNFWIYRQRLNQISPSLAALASDAWPSYRAEDRPGGAGDS